MCDGALVSWNGWTPTYELVPCFALLAYMAFTFYIKLFLSPVHELSSFYAYYILPGPTGGGMTKQLHGPWLCLVLIHNTSSEYSGIMTSLILAGDVLFDVTLHPVGFLCCRNTQFIHTELVVHQGPPGPFSTELVPSWEDPSMCCSPALCFPRCKTLHLSLLNFISF